MSNERAEKQCPCGMCHTLGGATGLYWVCEDMPEVDPEFCPHCGAHLGAGGECEPRPDAAAAGREWIAGQEAQR